MIDFSPQYGDMAVKLIVATFFGSLIGLEREFHGKEAGLRTCALVSLGSALVMMVSIQMYEIYKDTGIVDPSRIAAQAVSGIGFLGAGAIIRDPSGVRGLTSAASIWTVSGVGLAVGAGLFWPALITTVIVLFVLAFLSKVNRFIGKRGE